MSSNGGGCVSDGRCVLKVGGGVGNVTEAVLHGLRVMGIQVVECRHRCVVLVKACSEILADFGDGALDGAEVLFDVGLKGVHL